MVDTATEGDVATWQATIEIDVVRLWECCGIPIRGGPEEKNGRPSGNVHVTEFGVLRG